MGLFEHNLFHSVCASALQCGSQNLFRLRSFFSFRLEDEQAQTVQKLELSLKRYYIVFCVQTGKTEKALEFFKVLAAELSSNRHWKHWFVLPYLKKPDEDPTFRVFFNKSWVETFSLSLHNFLSTIFRTMPLPRLLNFNVERNLRRALEGNLLALKQENEALRSQLHNLRREMERVKSAWPTVTPVANAAATPGATAATQRNTVTATSLAPPPQPPSSLHSSAEQNVPKATGSPESAKTPPATPLHSSSQQVPNPQTGTSQHATGVPAAGTTPTSTQAFDAPAANTTGATTTSPSGSISSRDQQLQPGVGYVSFEKKKNQSESVPNKLLVVLNPVFSPRCHVVVFHFLLSGKVLILSKTSFLARRRRRKKVVEESSRQAHQDPPRLAQPIRLRVRFTIHSKLRARNSSSSSAPSFVRPGTAGPESVSSPKSRDESAASKPVPLVVSRCETFTASGAITSCKFSPDGTYMACGTAAGNVRIWPLSMQTAKNSATIYGSSEILSLEWETKTGKLLLCGTGDAKIKVWSVGGDKVIGDLQLPSGYSRVRKIACNPVDQSFACAATSQSDIKSGALFTWNLRTLQPIVRTFPRVSSLP